MDNNRNFASRLDWTLIFILLGFLVVSLLAISSAQTSGQYGVNYVPLQLRWYAIGVVIISIVIFFEPDQYKKMAWHLYGFGILLPLFLFLPEGKDRIAERISGAKSWYHTPLGNIQPSSL